MRKIEKIAVIGGDARQAALSSLLADEGYETATWAVKGDVGNAVRCVTWQNAVNSASAVILPIVAEDDMGKVNAPFASKSEGIPTLREILDESNAVVFGGKLSQTFVSYANTRHKEVVDYFASEELQVLNALPTAEGAVAVALEHLGVTIYGARVLVVGYGRIGKALSALLARMGACVDVAARKASDISKIEISFLTPKPLSSETLLQLVQDGYDVVFNTVPCVLFDTAVLEKASNRTLYIDLASSPGGFDFSAAELWGINVLRALSLPGKYFPITAGRIIGKTIINYLNYFEKN
jgi:dipicolinate synthase subunit A